MVRWQLGQGYLILNDALCCPDDVLNNIWPEYIIMFKLYGMYKPVWYNVQTMEYIMT